MAMKHRSKSEIQPTFYPPTVMPPFMSVDPPTKMISSGINYFQNYRNETLSKFSMPPYEWGGQKIPYSPQPDIAAGKKARRRINSDLATLTNDISTIDAARMREVDDVFKSAQIHRNQYKDRTGSVHPLAYFKPDSYNYQCAPGMTVSYLTKYPQHYIEYKIPTVLPLTYERRKQTPYIPDLSLIGIYNETSCIAYKR
ncbi:hypothetical protein ANTPLA_LOCUS1867 [Anthophora plagiata]